MKTLYNILFIFLCCITFLFVFCFSTIASFTEKWHTTLKYIRVDWNDSYGKVYKDLKFNATEDCGYDLYLPRRKNYYGQYPLILFIHGGSFTGGDKSEGDSWCKYYTSKGCISATVNYTLLNEKHTSNLNIMHNDIRDCVSAIKEVCEEEGYPISEMATTGISAGGCLAMLYAYREAEDSPIPVKFVFQQTGPTSFYGEHWGIMDDSTKMAFASLITGETITDSMYRNGEYHKLVASVSPAHTVTSNSVPTICAYGPNDLIVPTNQKYILFAALDSCNVPYHYIEFPNSGHALANDPDSMAAFVNRSDEYCRKYFKNIVE